MLETVRLNNYNSAFVVKDKGDSNVIFLEKLKILHSLKIEEYEQMHLRIVDQKEIVLYDKILASFPLDPDKGEISLNESFAITDHLTVQIVSCGFVGFDFEVLFELKEKSSDEIRI